MSLATDPWPDLSADWSGTRDALQLYLQIVGKYRLARTPWQIHSWHATFHVTARGLTTTLVDDGRQGVEATVDLAADLVRVQVAGGGAAEVPLAPMAVADFHARFRAALRAVGADDSFHGRPNELADPVPFAADTAPRPWDGDAARRFHRALVTAHGVFEEFRSGFLGKASPVHLFWGAVDLAVTRFSGRPAPPHPGGIPALPDEVTREAYSHEVASVGLWPGGGISDEAAFYAYAYPTPDGFSAASLSAPAAQWHAEAGEFLLPYAAVRAAADPRGMLLTFLQETYDAAARTGDWPPDLTCPMGVPGRPRPLA